MAAFFHMGGYAGFVWSAYGLTALVAGGLVVWCIRGHRAAKARVAALEAKGGEAADE